MKLSQKTVRCIDWSRIVFDLEAQGMSQRAIAAECGFADTDDTSAGGGKHWVNRIKNLPDTQPPFHEGALLLGLWAEKVGRPLGDVPRAEYRYVRNVSGKVQALPLVDRAVQAGADS